MTDTLPDTHEQVPAQPSAPVLNIDDFRPGAPRGALTWDTAAQRNRVLMLWRRAVLARFDERQVRVIKLCWVLSDSFNAKKGYAFPTNAWLAEETGMAENKVQAALKELEDGRAIVRSWITHPNGRKQRVIYPGRAILPRHGGTPMVGAGGDPQQPGVHNLSKRPRIPKTELERAQNAARIRQEREDRDRGTDHHHTDEEH